MSYTRRILELNEVHADDEFASIWNDEEWDWPDPDDADEDDGDDQYLPTIDDIAAALDMSPDEAVARARELVNRGIELKPRQVRAGTPKAYAAGHRYNVTAGLVGSASFAREFQPKKELAAQTGYALVPREPTREEEHDAAMTLSGRQRLAKGFTTGPHLEIIDRFYKGRKKKFQHLAKDGKDNAYLVIPSTTGHNLLSHMFAERLKKDFGGDVFDDYALRLYLRRAGQRIYGVRSSIQTPSKYIIDRNKLPDMTGRRVVLVDDSMNSGETFTAMADALRDVGIHVSDAVVLSAASSPDKTPPVEQLERMVDRTSRALTQFRVPFNKKNIKDDVFDAFQNQSYHWWHQFTNTMGSVFDGPWWIKGVTDPDDIRITDTPEARDILAVLMDYTHNAAVEFREAMQSESLRAFINGVLIDRCAPRAPVLM
jgi:hypothetical protein